jgi:hypothetical protein
MTAIGYSDPRGGIDHGDTARATLGMLTGLDVLTEAQGDEHRVWHPRRRLGCRQAWVAAVSRRA